MDLENTGKDWKDEAPLLAAMDRTNPLTEPKDYFNTLKANIVSRCLIEDARFENEEEFSVPPNYFDSLPAQIGSRIAEETIRTQVSSDGFTVPEGYFPSLQQRILSKTATIEEPVETIIKPIKRNWLKYAAAACVTLVIGSMLVFNNQENSFEAQLSSIPDQEIINYLQVHSDMSDTPMIMESLMQTVNLNDRVNDLSDDELEDYINTTL